MYLLQYGWRIIVLTYYLSMFERTCRRGPCARVHALHPLQVQQHSAFAWHLYLSETVPALYSSSVSINKEVYACHVNEAYIIDAVWVHW